MGSGDGPITWSKLVTSVAGYEVTSQIVRERKTESVAEGE